MTSLYELHRPSQWSEVVGQQKAVATLQRLAQTGLSGRAYWISGSSGTGKTTIARLIAAEAADAWAITEFTDPSELTAEALRAIRDDIQRRPFGRGYCIIVNEAHGCRTDLIRKLLGLTETIPAWITWVFTTTSDGQDKLFDDCDDASPLLSRCLRLDLARRDLAQGFAERARSIAQAAGLDGQPIEKYVRLAKDCRNNMRAMLSAIEAGAMLEG